MPLETGHLLAHYRLVEKIGEGGMGVVWKAEDTKLGRAVAIKVLPDLFAADPERLARFEREARLLAALNHPNIGAIHGLEEAEDIRFLVLELVGGETLGERLRRGPLSTAETLDVCGQIADAVAAAHEQGILHRDLKPANVKVTDEGKVKVLDFGLAKTVETSSTDTSLSASPTLTTAGTQAGVVLGTASYMSPEQARGKAVDRRTDVWAFGCVLYECLTARQVFAGETVTDILGAILHREPDWDRLSPGLPGGLLRLLRRCLQRDRRNRLHDIADARIALEEAGSEPETTTAPGRRLHPLALVVGGGALLVAGFLAGAFFLGSGRTGSGPDPEIRFTVRHESPPAPASAAEAATPRFRFFVPPVSLSPDGSRMVYSVMEADGVFRLYLRELGRLDAEPIPGSEGGFGPFFSPDGESLGFSINGELRVVRLSGGTPKTLASIGNFKGGAWTDDGHILYTPDADSGIHRISAEGGESEKLSMPDPDQGERTHRWPSALPDGEHLVVTVGTSTIRTFDDANIAVWSAKTGELRTLVEGGMFGRFLPPGHLLFARDRELYAAPFDPEALELTGTPEMVAESVATDPLTGAAAFSVSRTGTLAYVAGSPTETYQLWSVGLDGRAELVREESDYFADLDISPDGRFLAVEIDGANTDIWIYDLRRQVMSRLTYEWNNLNPLWTLDGERIVYTLGRAGTGDLVWRSTDGSGEPEVLVANDRLKLAESWSPDGAALAFEQVDPQTGRDIWILEMEGRTVTPFVQTPFDERSPVFSPDGKWVAYVSDENGRSEIFVRPYPGPGGKWQISVDGGDVASWTPDGKSLIVVAGPNAYQVDVTTEPRFEAGRPRPLFTTDLLVRSGDLKPDGSGFFVVVSMDMPTPAAEIQVLVHWAAANLAP